MILKTKNFQEAANKILLAVGVDKAAANLELARILHSILESQRVVYASSLTFEP